MRLRYFGDKILAGLRRLSLVPQHRTSQAWPCCVASSVGLFGSIAGPGAPSGESNRRVFFSNQEHALRRTRTRAGLALCFMKSNCLISPCLEQVKNLLQKTTLGSGQTGSCRMAVGIAPAPWGSMDQPGVRVHHWGASGTASNNTAQ